MRPLLIRDVRRPESIDPDDCDAAPRELVQRGAAHGAQPGDDDVAPCGHARSRAAPLFNRRR
jgi:hypothetical protein